MAHQDIFNATFDSLATDGCIGDPGGVLAYAYLRVSSTGQADEGRSGLPRQVLHVHEAALTHGYRVPWELVYADDHTGFAFEDRPQLTRLRHEYSQHNRRASAIIIENLDRLSRNADWHQGFLLDEFRQHGLTVVFWKGFASRVERAVIGAISQEGMEQALQRMREGNLHKARDGRVTARTRAYGYQFVDADGNVSPRSRKDSHYAPHPEEAPIIQLIYEKIALDGMSTRALAAYLEQSFPPPGKARHWEPTQIVLFVRNSLYKGQFIANRSQEITVASKRHGPTGGQRLVKRKVVRPESEWIIVPVPALVSEELWEQANRAITQNGATKRRNARKPYLLTGLVKCATCGYTYYGGRRRYLNKPNANIARFYRCGSSTRVPAAQTEIGCDQGQIACHFLDDAVWAALCTMLLQPEWVETQLLGHAHTDDDGLTRQKRVHERQLRDLEREDEKLYRAYVADVFDEHEYSLRRAKLKDRQATLAAELATLGDRQAVVDAAADRRALLRTLSRDATAMGIALAAPFELKQRIIKLLVDKITLNVRERWFHIQGALPPMLSSNGQPGQMQIRNIPADRG